MVSPRDWRAPCLFEVPRTDVRITDGRACSRANGNQARKFPYSSIAQSYYRPSPGPLHVPHQHFRQVTPLVSHNYDYVAQGQQRIPHADSRQATSSMTHAHQVLHPVPQTSKLSRPYSTTPAISNTYQKATSSQQRLQWRSAVRRDTEKMRKFLQAPSLASSRFSVIYMDVEETAKIDGDGLRSGAEAEAHIKEEVAEVEQSGQNEKDMPERSRVTRAR